MNKKVLFGLLAVLLLGTGVLVYKVVSTPKQCLRQMRRSW